MWIRRLVLILSLPVLLTACATTTHEVVQLPERSADLYPEHYSANGVTVAVDPVQEGARSERYFGADLGRRDVLPIIIVVSNLGDSRVAVDPADVVMTRGNRMIDPLPPEVVVDDEMLGSRMSGELREQVREYMKELVLQRQQIAPGDTYRGVMFFPLERNNRLDSGGFRIRDFAFGGLLSMQIAVTDVETGERHRLGPFQLRHSPGHWSGRM